MRSCTCCSPRSLPRGGSHTLAQLREELDRAVIIDPAAVPSGIVTLELRVEYEDVDTGEVEDYTITFPELATIDAQRISVLTPIGVALIGCRVGDIVRWTMREESAA